MSFLPPLPIRATATKSCQLLEQLLRTESHSGLPHPRAGAGWGWVKYPFLRLHPCRAGDKTQNPLAISKATGTCSSHDPGQIWAPQLWISILVYAVLEGLEISVMLLSRYSPGHYKLWMKSTTWTQRSMFRIILLFHIYIAIRASEILFVASREESVRSPCADKIS